MNRNRLSAVKESVFLPTEDRNRMSRLYEEVWVRLDEMAMITARTLKLHASRPCEVRFCPVTPKAESECEAVELVRTSGSGWGCYDYRQGLCFDSEAGSF